MITSIARSTDFWNLFESMDFNEISIVHFTVFMLFIGMECNEGRYGLPLVIKVNYFK